MDELNNNGYQQPSSQNSGYQQPGYQQPGYQQPNYQQTDYQNQGYQQPGYQQPNYQQTGYQNPGVPPQYSMPTPPPENHLVGAILATIFCCWPFGIPAIVNAAKVDKLWFSGAQAAAMEAAAKAKKWMMVSIILAAVFWVLYILFVIVAGVGIGMAEAGLF
jgi:hypothetical protein